MNLDMSLRDWYLMHQGRLLGRLDWMGIPVMKCPTDLAIYWEIVFERKPDTIVEIGSAHGGSTLFFACLLDLLGRGMVLSVDKDRSRYKADRMNIFEITGDSASPEVHKNVQRYLGERVMVVHDGGHTEAQVAKDLRLYHRYVTRGQYLVVEDTIIDYFKHGDSIGTRGPGPLPAVRKFCQAHPEFVRDERCERYGITYNPEGWLRRIR